MKDKIQAYIRDELLGGREIGADENLLLSGLVDSMGIMRLVQYLEQQFDLTVPPEDVTIENFMTIREIERYARERGT